MVSVIRFDIGLAGCGMRDVGCGMWDVGCGVRVNWNWMQDNRNFNENTSYFLKYFLSGAG